MKNNQRFILLAALLFASASMSYAQPATTAKTFRMYNDATHTISFTAGNGLGTGTFTWPQPATGFLKSDATGAVSIGAVDLSSSDVTNVLNVSNGGTGTNTVGSAGSVAYSDGSKISYSAVGSTGQLFVSGGSGSPTWTSTFPTAIGVPFNQITTGTNTTATMTVGSGSSLAPAGTGTITANQFVGTGSLTGAVDLTTAEVSGALGVTNGGTGSTAVGPAGTIAYSNGTQYAFTSAGTSGQVLTSAGSGTPIWTSVITAKAAGRIQGDGTNFAYTITPGGGSGYSATSVVVVSLESVVSQTLTITAKTATNFTVQSPTVLSNSDFINYVVY